MGGGGSSLISGSGFFRVRLFLGDADGAVEHELKLGLTPTEWLHILSIKAMSCFMMIISSGVFMVATSENVSSDGFGLVLVLFLVNFRMYTTTMRLAPTHK